MTSHGVEERVAEQYQRFQAKVAGIVGTQSEVHWQRAGQTLLLEGEFSLNELRLLIATVEEVYGCGHEEGRCDCPH